MAIAITACEKNEFELTTNADEFFFLRNDGADMPVWVKGNTASKTMIVFLHGGPGGKGSFNWEIQISDFVSALTEDYAMILFDQRGRASSQGHFDGDLMTNKQFVEDIDKLITLLYAKYGSDINIFLYGVSWGGYLGTAYITTGDNQHKIKGWINDSGNHDWLLAVNSGKNMLYYYAQQQLTLNKNKEDWTEILNWCEQKDTIIEYMDFEQAFVYFDQACRLMNDSTVNTYNRGSKERFSLTYNSPYSPSGSFSNKIFNYQFWSLEFFHGLKDLSNELYKVNIPVFLARGKYDFKTPQPVHDEMFELINSDVKYKVTFNSTEHAVCFGETDLFVGMIKDFINENK